MAATRAAHEAGHLHDDFVADAGDWQAADRWVHQAQVFAERQVGDPLAAASIVRATTAVRGVLELAVSG